MGKDKNLNAEQILSIHFLLLHNSLLATVYHGFCFATFSTDDLSITIFT